MQPVFFSSAPQLLGLYHPPEATTRNSAVVLCHSIWSEYFNAYRAFRVLATRLARAGHHVLRFDYCGTGDSEGNGDPTLEQWVGDIDRAIEFLKQTSGVSQVTLGGLRLGACLALVSGSERSDVDRLILWQPILSGARFLAEQKAAHAEWLRDGAVDRPNSPQCSTDADLLGNRLTPALAQGLGQLDLAEIGAAPGRPTLLVTEDEPDAMQALSDRWRQTENHIDHRVIRDGAKVWTRGVDFEQALVPSEIINVVVGWANAPA